MIRKNLSEELVNMDISCGVVPEPGTAYQVAPGVMWVRMPMPLPLDHVNIWAVKESVGWTIVDSGLSTEATEMSWRALFAAEGALQGGPARVIATHMHQDHVGMAGWLARKFRCVLWMTGLEYLRSRVHEADDASSLSSDEATFYRRAGWDEEVIKEYRARYGYFGRYLSKLPRSYRRVRDGEHVRIGLHDWRVITGAGHSPEHACLYCAELKVFISGDQVLPRISSNVSVSPIEPDANPLDEWLLSLRRMAVEVPDDVLVLPSHQEPFRGLHARLESLTREVDASIVRLKSALKERKRAVDVFADLFSREITGGDLHHLRLATGESLAHLNYLWHRGEVSREIDRNGVAWYQNLPSQVQ